MNISINGVSTTTMNNQFCDAFISYGRADSKAFARELHSRLVEQELKVWFDQNGIPLGVDFQNQIDDGIEKAHNFLHIIAPHSVNSPYCGKEIELALKRHKRIIPLLHVEQISRDTRQQRYPQRTDADWEAYQAKGLHSSFSNMHPEIGKINWVYFREGIDDFDKSLEGLLGLLTRHKEYVSQHTFFLAKALDWQRNQKQSRHLLVGEERQQAEDWLKIRFKGEQAPCTPTDLHCEYITESIKNGHNLMTQVNGVAFSPDGKLIASGSDDQTVKLWQPDGTLLKTLTGHQKQVKAVAFSPDDRSIASVSSDNTVILWDIDKVQHPEQLEAEGCDLVQDYLQTNTELIKSDRQICNQYNFSK